MPKKRVAQPTLEDEAVVRLRPLFGVDPPVYLPWVFGGVLLALIFALLLLPGLVNPGSQVTFISKPDGASVHLDGTRIGATPLTTFVDAGRHEVRFSRTFHAAETIDVRVSRRLFGSLFVPKKQEVRSSLALRDGSALVDDTARRFSAWSLAGDQHAQYQYPPILSDAVEAAYAAGTQTGRALSETLLNRAGADVHTTAMLKDYVRGFLSDASRGSALGPFGIARAAQSAALAVDRSPGLPYALAAALPEPLAETLVAAPWYEEFTGAYVTRYIPYTSESSGQNELGDETIAGYRFVRIPEGTFVQGLAQSGGPVSSPPEYQPPIVRRVDSFLILDREVTRRLFRRFIAENPAWSRESVEELQREGLVGDEYLAWHDEDASRDALPATHVSYPAASAFADWFQGRLPATYRDARVRLPTEAEWERAARAAAASPEEAVFRAGGVDGPRPVTVDRTPTVAVADLLGNVWEWTSSWYHPAAYAVAEREEDDSDTVTEATFAEQPGDQRVVRGGSWVNPPRSVGVVTRGSQPPEATTSFLGFRIVIVEETAR
ncbi:MAG: SUMF1/EgtB/PvdO family nonheme iron enzyme [Spirochaetaceae bacterium]